MGRTAPPFAIAGPPGPSLSLRSPSSPRRRLPRLLLALISAEQSSLLSRSRTGVSYTAYTYIPCSVFTIAYVPPRTDISCVCLSYPFLFHRRTITSPSVFTSVVIVASPPSRPSKSLALFTYTLPLLPSFTHTLFTVINVCPTNISSPPMMRTRARMDARGCVCVSFVYTRRAPPPLPPRRTGTRKCLPILLPTVVRSR